MSAAPQRPECDRGAFSSRRPYFTVRWIDYCVASFIILTGFLQIQAFVTFDSKYWQPVPGSDGSLNGTYEKPTWVHVRANYSNFKLYLAIRIFDEAQYQAEPRK